MRTTASQFAAATGEWEAVFQSLPTPDEGWATAKAVAEVVHLSPSTVTRRLQALQEGGRVESSTDKAVTGARGRVWRQRADGPRVLGPTETLHLPVDDVEPDPVQRYVDAAENGVFDEVRDGDPVGRACERCGGAIDPNEAAAGYTRCEVCDPDGDHSVHGPAPELRTDAAPLPATEMSTDEANEEFDGLPTSMVADDEDGDPWPLPGDSTASGYTVEVDDEDGDPSPVSPAPTGGDYAAIAEALAPAADPLTAQDARALTDRIRLQVADLLPLIKEAYNRRAHVALGYVSWAEYCDTELRGLRMPLAERQAATAELAAEGMSTRAIAGALGSSDATVRRDLAATGATAAAPERVTGLDGRSYPAHKPKTAVAAATVADGGGGAGTVDPGTPEDPSNSARRERSRRAHQSVEQRDEPMVWIATAREGVTYHLPADDGLTACKRSMRTGDQVSIGLVEWRHGGTPCERCWPEPTSSTPGFDAAARLTPAELGIVPGVNDNPAGPTALADDPRAETVSGDSRPLDRPGAAPVDTTAAEAGSDDGSDPAAQIAAVAEVAPDYVRPAGTALEGEVLPAPAPRALPDQAYRIAVADGIRALGKAIDALEQLTWDAGVGGTLTLPDLKHERRRLNNLISHLQKPAA